METIKLWLEEDEEIPQFKRLRFTTVPVSLADVLLRGIHPWRGREDTSRLRGRGV